MSDSVQAASKADTEIETVEGQEICEPHNETLQLALKASEITLKENENKNKEENEVNNQNESGSKKVIVSSKCEINNDYMKMEGNFSLNNLINELEKTLKLGHYKEKHIFDKVQWLMEHYDATNEDYQKYALKLDKNQYTRNLIKNSPYFTLMLLVWPPLIASPVHDHGGSECWLRVIKGSLEERFYEKPQYKNSAIKLRFSEVHKSDDVCFINDDQGLHSINNPLNDIWSISLHCYVPGYESCNAFFDINNAEKGKKSCKLTFTSINGIKLND